MAAKLDGKDGEGRHVGWRRVLAATAMLAVWAALSPAAAMARDPELRIALDPMGYQTLVPEFLLTGSSMLTVHFVDKDHLLITFNVRRLMKREVDPPADDYDRTIGAFLVELPSGKVLARTEWRVHDRAQYLWNIGHGRFLLRVRDRLTTFAPMEAAKPEDAFREVPLLRIDRHIVAILVSSNDDLLTVETTKRATTGTEQGGVASPVAKADPAPVQINFYRLTNGGASADQLLAVSAGAIRTREAVALPMTTSGFLEVLEGGRNRWLFNFNAHTGKVSELAPFDTSCYPRATFVGHAEFVAFGCRGSAEKQDLAGFNLKGEEMWQQNFFDTHVSPTFAFAPEAGRFALSRTIVGGTVDPSSLLAASQVNAQEVRVYQSYDGKLLFRTECSPVERAGQNFALSPDGLRVAVVHETTTRHAAVKDFEAYTTHTTAVYLYPLPPLTDKDRAEVKAAEKLAPEDTGVGIDLSLRRFSAPTATSATAAAKVAAEDAAHGAASAGNSAGLAAAAPLPVEMPKAAEQSAPDAAVAGTEAATEGDPEPTAARKPPTLYGPGEAPSGKSPK